MKLSDIFQINDDFRDCKLLSGRKGLSNEVSCVAILEVPDGAFWVKENQLIITMGYALKKQDITMASLIQMLIDKKAAGLGIKLGRFIDKISPEDLDYADRHDFPIFSIPLSMDYEKIITPIENLMDSSYCDCFSLNKMRRELSETLMQKCDVGILLDFLEKHLNKPVYLLKYQGYIPYMNHGDSSDTKKIIYEVEKIKSRL